MWLNRARCRFTHDLQGYLSAKPRDVKFPTLSDLSNQPPFVSLDDSEVRGVANQATGVRSSLDPATTCPVHAETGKCKHGFKCRFLGAHAEGGSSGELSLVVDGEKVAHAAVSAAELNFVDPDIRKQLRTRKVTTFRLLCGHNSADGLHCDTTRDFSPIRVQYPRPVSDAYLKEIQQLLDAKGEERLEPPGAEVNPMESSGTHLETSVPSISGQDVDMSQADTPDTPMRFTEKKRLDWSGKTCKWFHPIERLG